jgi:hypothetical protein
MMKKRTSLLIKSLIRWSILKLVFSFYQLFDIDLQRAITIVDINNFQYFECIILHLLNALFCKCIILHLLFKQQMQNNARTVSNAILRIQKAEKNELKLIFIVSFSYIILRMPNTVYQVPFQRSNSFWDCYYFPVTLRLYDFSYFF